MLRVAFCVGEYPGPEREKRIAVAKSYASEEVEIGILDIPASPYPGLGHAGIQQVHPILHKVFIQAEKEGYDAVVPLGMLDLGIEGGRCLVNIPVLGPLHSALHVAGLLGDRFGLVCYEASAFPRYRAVIKSYNMYDFIAGFRTVSTPINVMTENRDQMVEAFLAGARSLIDDDGAEVIIPAGISQCPVHMSPTWLSSELGVPVVEGIGAPIRVAAMLASLGYKHSRVRWPYTPMPD